MDNDDMNMNRHFECLSALQKAVRRSDERAAGYWAFSLADGPLAHAMFSRLLVIAHEDVGPADPPAVMFATVCVNQARDWKKSDTSAWRLALGNAVLALCRARKARTANNFQRVCRGDVEREPNREVPDYALDQHTRRGKAKARGMDHFFAEGAKLIQPFPIDAALDLYSREAEELYRGDAAAGRYGKGVRTDEDIAAPADVPAPKSTRRGSPEPDGLF